MASIVTTTKTTPAAVPVRWLPILRASIIGMFVIVDVLFVLGISHFYDQLTTLCSLPNCRPLVLTAQDVAALETVGLSASFYAWTHIAIEIANVLFVNLFCIYYLRRLMTHWMGYVTCLLFIQFMLMPNVIWAYFETYPSLNIFGEGLIKIGLGAFFVLLYIFPRGRLIPRWSGLFLLAGLAAAFRIPVTDSYDEFKGTELTDIYLSPFLMSLIASILFQIYRYVRLYDPIERRQTRWVISSIPLMILGFLGWGVLIEYLAFQPGMPRVWIHLFSIPIIMVITVVPITLALTIAIVQEKLWDIEIIINRSLVYVVVTAIVLITYLFVISLLGLVFDVHNNLVVSLLATGAVALGFQIVRQYVQRAVNRLMFGQRDEPQTVLANLTRQLQTVTLPEDLLQVSTETIGKSLHLPYVAVAIRHGEATEKQAEYGSNGLPTQAFPLVHQNEAVGELIVSQRSPNESLNAADQSVLSSVVLQLGAVVYAVRLHAELQTARERLVIAREEERRRIRRDLHDGLGPALASQPLQFDIAIESIPKNPALAVEVLEDMKRNTQSLVSDIRRIIQDLRPPALDELGLAEALQGAITRLKAHPNQVNIDLNADLSSQHISAATEAAAYHIVMEAVTNVIKHAQAEHCWICLDTLSHPPRLRISIEDDGMGFPRPLIPNVGLTSMRERAEELGGSFSIQLRSTSGTQIAVALPVMKSE